MRGRRRSARVSGARIIDSPAGRREAISPRRRLPVDPLLSRRLIPVMALALGLVPRAASQEVTADLSAYSPDCGVEVKREGPGLVVGWPTAEKERGRLVLDFRAGRPIIESIGIAAEGGRDPVPLLRGVAPVTFLTVGTRQAPAGRPPEMSRWNVFFDKPASRPHKTYLAKFDLRRARVVSEGR